MALLFLLLLAVGSFNIVSFLQQTKVVCKECSTLQRVSRVRFARDRRRVSLAPTDDDDGMRAHSTSTTR